MPRRAERIVKRGNNAKQRHCVNEEMDGFREMDRWISGRKDDRENQNDLNSSGRLAVNAWRKRPVTGDKQNHDGHHKYQNVSAENDDREPPRNLFLKRQNNERRRKQQLIGDGVEIRAERRTLIKAAREQAVYSIREPRNNKHQQRPFVPLIGNKNEKERQEAEPQQSDLIGNRPNSTCHYSS